ncbi:MAG: RNA methyltransferase [Pseudonocardiales bacterium]|nr:MAG: RNA methyltransferase [Pseudonocardiales bacterium]
MPVRHICALRRQRERTPVPSRTELITSAANPVVKRIRLLLADRRHRAREQAFVVEGVAPVWQAVEAGAEIETLVVAPELLAGSPAAAMVAEQADRGMRITRLSAELFGRISDRDGPSGLAAIVQSRLPGLSDVAVSPDSAYVALNDVGNPGNLGTILRTGDAAGISAVMLVGHTADPFAPAAVKASMGAIFSVPVVRVSTVDQVADWAREHEVSIVTTSGAASTALWDAPLRPPLLVVMGGERDGLAAETIELGDLAVSIPMTGTAESLNLAVATGIVVYEIRRQNRDG